MRAILSVTCLCYCVFLFGQGNFCGTSYQDQKSSINQLDLFPQGIKKDGGFIYVPLMVHNVSNDNSQSFYAPWSLFETLCTLNEDFKPSGLQFYLERDFNYINNSSWNDHAEFYLGEMMMNQSNIPGMANCYLVTNPAGNCGYFTYSGDGVALSKSCLGKKSHTWAHELGHYFSLPHTFYGWEGIQYSNGHKTVEYQGMVTTSIENVERDHCKNQADRFCDTRPDYISNRWTCGGDGFSNVTLVDTRDSLFRVDGSLFMSYSNDECMSRFSIEQMDAMNRNLQGPRADLKRNNVTPKYINQIPFNTLTPITNSEINSKKVNLNWESVPNAKYYVLQISRTSTFTIIIKNLLLYNPHAEIDSLIAGRDYWWRVRAFSEFDFCGTESNVGSFKTMEVVTGTNDENFEIEGIYPNPVYSFSKIQVNFTGLNNVDKNISLHDVNGRSIEIYNQQTLNSTVLFDIGFIPDGIYFINLKAGSEFRIYKMIVKNN
jgi:hypothetical protein